MNFINPTSKDIGRLNLPIAFDQQTIIGVDATDSNQGVLVIIPCSEVTSLCRGQRVDQEAHGENIVEVLVNTTEGEETYYLYDYMIVAAHEGHITL